jgi:hypothetical protein
LIVTCYPIMLVVLGLAYTEGRDLEACNT